MQDLRHTASALALLSQMQGFQSGTVARSLFESALISYRRCFEEGRGPFDGHPRRKLAFESVPSRYRTVHDWLWNVSNKVVAHEVSGRAEASVFVEAASQGGERRYRVGATEWRLSGPTDTQLEEIAAMLDVMIVQVETECAQLELQVIADAKLFEPWN